MSNSIFTPIAAVAMVAAPLIAPASSTQAVVFAKGQMVITQNTPYYDAKGNVLKNQSGKVGDQRTYIDDATINGQAFYQILPNLYVPTSAAKITNLNATQKVPDASKPAAKPTVKPTTQSTTKVHIAVSVAAIVNSQGQDTGRRLAKGTDWKGFGTLTIGGATYYCLGGDQYVAASDVGASVPLTAVGTVSYVPGYGIQVWTQDSGLVFNENGSAKKLAHGTSWKVFAKMTLRGTTYYNLGGNQWLDGSYLTIR